MKSESTSRAVLPRAGLRVSIILALGLLVGCDTLPMLDPTRPLTDSVDNFIGSEDDMTQTGPVMDPRGLALGDEGPIAPKSQVEYGTGQFINRIAPAPVMASNGDITLNFDNTNIREVVQVILGDLLGVNYVLHPAVQGAATLQTDRPLAREDLLPTLETLLRMNNAAVVEGAEGYEVLPIAAAGQGRLVPQLGDSNRSLPEGYALRIVPLEYIGAAEMAEILLPLAPEGSIVRIDSARNLLLLAGQSTVLRNLIETVQIFDADWMAGLSVGFFTLEYANAEKLVGQIETLLADEDGSRLAGMVRFIPIESSNALMVVSPQPGYLEKMEAWIKRLDQAESYGSNSQRLFVYRVRHGDADHLSSILGQLFGGTSSTSNQQRSIGSVDPTRTSASIGGDGSANTEKKTTSVGASSRSFELSSDVSIVSDSANNSLLIKASPRDYQKILDALKQLDINPLQVLVEARIVEVRLTGSLEYGVQWQFDNAVSGYRSQETLSGPSPQSTPYLDWSIVNSAGVVKATLSALARDGLVNVLSAPSVMVLDNQKARIQVGKEVPIATAERQGTSIDDEIVNSIQYRDTGVILTVTPRVTPGGSVQMEIEQEVSDVDTSSSSDLKSPTFITRKITSSVSVGSNQSVVLGGLIQNLSETGKGGVPGLYQLPVIGGLFGGTSKSAERTELIIILTPRVVSSDADLESVTRDFREKVRRLDLNF